ncbi:MAG: hypothetical protein WBH31_09150 [Promethearchaeia archaeon]
MKNSSENNNSWLCNPFGDARVYTTRITLDEEFSWEFFFKEDSKKEAYQSAESFLLYLKEVYPGLAGQVKVRGINYMDLQTKKQIFELILPNPVFAKKINLIKKIMNLFPVSKEFKKSFFISWQEDDSVIKELENFAKLKQHITLDENYKAKVFFLIEPKFNNNSEISNQVIEEIKEYMAMDIRNADNENASISDAPPDTWRYILEEMVFWKNILDCDTGRFYRRVEGGIPPEMIPAFISPKVVDFSFNHDIPLDKAFTIKNEKIGFNSDFRNNSSRILLGYYIKHGVITENPVYLHLEDLVQHIFMSGLTGVGKTTIESQLKQRIKKTGNPCGVLTIKLLKGNESFMFSSEIMLKKGDPKLRVPYIMEGEEIDQIIEQVAGYSVASVGLKNVVVSIMEIVLTHEYENKGKFPAKIKQAFARVHLHLEENPYHKKFQTNILKALENRVMKLLSNPILEKILETGPIPEWFIEWQNGKDVYIDLSGFKKSAQRLLVHAIFQLIRTCSPELDAKKLMHSKDPSQKLKNVIMMDEVGSILGKPKYQSYDDDETITKHYLEIVFEEFLSAFRSRGIGIILGDHMPSRLFEGVYKLPSIKILFRTDKEDLQKFGLDVEDIMVIDTLKNRFAFIKDGVNSRRFLFYTTDYEL